MEKNNALNDTIKAIEISVKEKNFKLVNILANRIVTDSVFLSEKFYCLFGIFVKEMSQIISFLNLTEDVSENIKEQLLFFLDEFKDLINSSSKEEVQNKSIILWTLYKNVSENLLTLQTLKEEENYSNNIEFTEQAINYMLNFVSEEYEHFSQKKRPLLLSLINELDRIFKNFGFEIKHLVLKTCISMYNRSFDHIIYHYSKLPDLELESGDLNFQKELKNLINIFDIYLSDVNELINKSDDILFDLAKKWRHYYLTYLDTIPRFIRIKKKPEEELLIPEEAKEKLQDIVSKSIEVKGDKE